MLEKDEIITAKEALERVNLGDLWGDRFEDVLVRWTGYPRPFRCGHTAVYGDGPLDHPEVNDRYGKGRRYQELTRVGQHLASGWVLFSWPTVSDDEPHYNLRFGLAVCVIETPDSKSTGLRAALIG